MMHFVGFKGDEFNRARRVFGEPDFIHRLFDARAKSDILPGEPVIFANGEETKTRTFSYNDSEFF